MPRDADSTLDVTCPRCGAETEADQRYCHACGTAIVAADEERTIGQYRLEREIARGGMGVVYAAYDERLKRWVALKLLLGDRASDPGFRTRFMNESRSALKLEHPHILPVLDTGEVDGSLYIATQLVDGEDLRRHLGRGGTLEPERALTIAAQIAGALDYAHSRGLVHRDVTPGNVLLVSDADGEADHAYLIDFGITTSPSRQTRVTAAGRVVGTPRYMSPEQISGRRVDRRADQYSLACVLYECLVGDSPFRRATDTDTFYAHLHESPPRPSKIVPGLAPSIDAAVMRALAKDPSDRFDSCRAFLASARDDETVSREIAFVRPRLRGSAAALAVVLLAAAGAYFAIGLLGDSSLERVATSTGPSRTTTRPPDPTLPALDVQGLSMRTERLKGYSIQVPAEWRRVLRDEPQPSPPGVSRRRTQTSARDRDLTLIVDALANFSLSPSENGKSLDRMYRRDPDMPGYEQTSARELSIGSEVAYQMIYRYTGRGGDTVYNADVILERGSRQFAVLATGRATSRDLAELAREIAGSIEIERRPQPPPPPAPPPAPAPAAPKAPAEGEYAGTGTQLMPSDRIDRDRVRITFGTKQPTVVYPGLGCSGTLYSRGIVGGRRTYTEEIERGRCPSGGRWRIERLTSKKIEGTRTHASEASPFVAILTR